MGIKHKRARSGSWRQNQKLKISPYLRSSAAKAEMDITLFRQTQTFCVYKTSWQTPELNSRQLHRRHNKRTFQPGANWRFPFNEGIGRPKKSLIYIELQSCATNTKPFGANTKYNNSAGQQWTTTTMRYQLPFATNKATYPIIQSQTGGASKQ